MEHFKQGDKIRIKADATVIAWIAGNRRVERHPLAGVAGTVENVDEEEITAAVISRLGEWTVPVFDLELLDGAR